MTEQNQELLLAISDMLDQKFEKELRPIKDDICELKTDVKELQSDVTELQSDVKELRSDVTELQSDVTELQSDVTKLQENVHGIHLYLENSCGTAFENAAAPCMIIIKKKVLRNFLFYNRISGK